MKQNWKTYFRGKKITIMGLGLLGRGINVAKFLARYGAILTITDLKPKEKLLSSIEELRDYSKQITYVLGEHKLEDFKDKDLIIKAAGVPLDNVFIDEARRNDIPVVMDASLFVDLAPDRVTVVGITGTRGKSTTTHLINHILRTEGKRTFLGGNVRGLATLPLLEEVVAGDYVVLELDSWQLQGFGEAKISPEISVFTNLMPDHMNYYKNDMGRYFEDKANVFLYQNPEDILVAGREIAGEIKRVYGSKIKARLVEVAEADFPSDWKISLPGVHNKFNATLAIYASRAMGVSDTVIRKAVESFEAVEGRLQLLGEKENVKVFNDNNATTPEATAAGLEAVASNGNVVLVMGGADKGLDTSFLTNSIKDNCKAVVLLSGTGTDKIKVSLSDISDLVIMEDERLEKCFEMATTLAKKGEVILFSPAFASFSKYFENEYQRNDLFVKLAMDWLVR